MPVWVAGAVSAFVASAASVVGAGLTVEARPSEPHAAITVTANMVTVNRLSVFMVVLYSK